MIRRRVRRDDQRGISNEHRAKWAKGKCRWCLGPVEPPRRTFCSDGCVREWKIRQAPRDYVFERDRGVCARCGRDCRALQTRLEQLLYTDAAALERELNHLGMTHRQYGIPDIDRRVPVHAKGRMGRPTTPDKIVWEPGRTLWEADHVTAVQEGGGMSGLDGLQTLCCWCHREKTAEHARRRAEARRRPPPDLFPETPRPPPDLWDD